MGNRRDVLLTDLDDPRIQELRERVKNGKPHQPNPGDPDYLTPEQVARILREREENDDGDDTIS